MKLVLFISPHYKKCGETYIFKNFFSKNLTNNKIDFKVFNYFKEFDHIDKKYIIQNPFKFNLVSKSLEKKIPWLYYRLWMIVVFFHLQIVLTYIIISQKKKYSEIVIVSRMSNIAAAFVSIYFKLSKKTKFYCSIAGLVYKNSFRKIIWNILIKKFEGVIIPTKDMKKHIFDYTKSKKILTIPNPVITSEMIKYRKKKFIYDKNKVLNVICIGRLSKQKGIDTLIRSIKSLKNVKLDIIGKGEEDKKLKEIVKKNNLDKRISFLGWRENPWKLIKNYHLFVMPSRWEGPGHTVIESLVQNIPVIVSDCKYGPLETIQKGKFGEYFRVDDVRDLTKKINNVKNNYQKFVKKSIAGGKFIRKNYSIENIAKQYIKNF